jgi:hypothetical protein
MLRNVSGAKVETEIPLGGLADTALSCRYLHWRPEVVDFSYGQIGREGYDQIKRDSMETGAKCRSRKSEEYIEITVRDLSSSKIGAIVFGESADERTTVF